MTITLSKNQSVFDAAIKHYGSVEGIRFLIEDNGPEVLNADPDGLTLKIRKEVINQSVVDYFENREIVSS